APAGRRARPSRGAGQAPPRPAAASDRIRLLRGFLRMEEGAPRRGVTPRVIAAQVCAALNRSGAKYLVIDGVACILHGYARTTEDVDILIERTEANAGRVLAALARVGYGFASEWAADEILKRPITVIGDDPAVDVFTVAWKVKYEQAAPRAEAVDVEGVRSPLIALTDSLDKRRFLLWGEGFIAVTSALMAGLVWLDLVTAPRLLVLAFLVSAGDALTAPPWQAVVPLLVPPAELRPAVAANGVGFNISRALGPALGGALVGPFGIAAPFIVNAVSNFRVTGALVWWRAPRETSSELPPERLWSAMRTGLRYARFSPPLRDTLIRAAGFFLFASAYWALLPLVARSQLAGGPTLYGILLGGIGVSAVAGALALPWLNIRLGPDRLAVAGALGTAAATALFGLAHGAATAVLASAIA